MKTRMARVVPEKVEQAHTVQLLRSLGGRVYVMGTRRRRGDFPGTMQTEGIPDVMAFLPKRDEPARRIFLFIESKSAIGRLRPEQAVFRDLCASAEVHHLVGGLNTVIAWLIERNYLRSEDVPHYRQPSATRTPRSASS